MIRGGCLWPSRGPENGTLSPPYSFYNALIYKKFTERLLRLTTLCRYKNRRTLLTPRSALPPARERLFLSHPPPPERSKLKRHCGTAGQKLFEQRCYVFLGISKLEPTDLLHDDTHHRSYFDGTDVISIETPIIFDEGSGILHGTWDSSLPITSRRQAATYRSVTPR